MIWWVSPFEWFFAYKAKFSMSSSVLWAKEITHIFIIVM